MHNEHKGHEFADQEVREELVQQMKSAYVGFGTVGIVFMVYQVLNVV